ncbi:MAG: hypothetical protein OEW09_05655, partial [Anaerolineae bacterium]|nr:hypothetical protein [Anaerolineae bacterium]
MFRKQRVRTGTRLVVGLIFALLLAAFMFSSRPLLAQGPTPQPTPPVNEIDGQVVPQTIYLPIVISSGGSRTTLEGPFNDLTLLPSGTVEDPLAQFQALKHHGEAIGWWNDESKGAPDPSNTNHYQGLVRYPGDGVPVFYVTQKKKDAGYLSVVRFGTRPTTGERLRSNLQVNGQFTIDTVPPQDDTWVLKPDEDGSLRVKPIRFDDLLKTPDETLTLHYEHPGGMAIIDDILFVPLDTPKGQASATGAIALFDLSKDGPESPSLIHAIPLTHKIDNLAVTEYGE